MLLNLHPEGAKFSPPLALSGPHVKKPEVLGAGLDWLVVGPTGYEIVLVPTQPDTESEIGGECTGVWSGTPAGVQGTESLVGG